MLLLYSIYSDFSYFENSSSRAEHFMQLFLGCFAECVSGHLLSICECLFALYSWNSRNKNPTSYTLSIPKP